MLFSAIIFMASNTDAEGSMAWTVCSGLDLRI